MADLTDVLGLTFEVKRDKVIGMLNAKIAFLQSASAAWGQAAEDDAWLEAQVAEEKKKAMAQAKAQGLPPNMQGADLKKEGLARIARKNVRLMQLGAKQWEVQRDFLSTREMFTLTQDQLNQLAVDDADKVFPPDWTPRTTS